jgi:PKD repeat protein
MDWYADDSSWSYNLPFGFPFYGTNYTTIYISSNGLITFTSPESSPGNGLSDLAGRLAIAPAWDDWRTDQGLGDDIYIWQPDSDHVIIRWQVVAYYNIGTFANFEAILGSDGEIKFNYGQNNGLISATVGISNGAGEILAEDVTDLNYINTILFTPFRPEHDLEVRLEAPTNLAPDRSAILNATVSNLGLNNETSVELQLFVNGTIVDSDIIPELLTGSSHTLSYSWTPADKGLYNITAYAPLVPDENVTANNVATRFVEVMYPLISPIEGQWANYTTYQFDNATGQIVSTAELSFTYDHYISPYQINITMSSRDSNGYITTGWMIVNVMNRMVESDSGIYWTGMWYPCWIETNITIGSTVNLLGGTATVVGSQMIFALDRGIYPIDCWELFMEYYGIEYTFWYDKTSGLWIGMEYTMYPYTAELALTATNIPLVRYEHELAVALEASSFVKLGDSSLLNATVYNLGLNNETDVELFLLINSTVVNSVTIPELLTGSSYTMSYLWTPTEEAVYNVTAYASPATNETIIENNIATRRVHVLTIERTFREDFNTFTLDPHWQMWTYGIPAPSPSEATYQQETRYSLTNNPGYLRYYPGSMTSWGIKEPQWNGPSSPYWYYPSMHLYRMFEGTNWMLETRVTYAASYANAPASVTYIFFGDPQQGEGWKNNSIVIIGAAWDAYHQVYVIENGTWKGPTNLPMNQYGDTFCYRVIRSGHQFTLEWSRDSFTYTTAFTETMGSQIDGLPQGIGITGQAFWSDTSTYSEYDCIYLAPLPEHELAVSLEVPTFVQFGKSSTLNATVCNRGLNNETDVELQLMINYNLVDSTIISELPTGSSYTLSYPWTPTVEGTYNVIAYAVPVTGENNTINNVATKLVPVISSLISPVEGQRANYTRYYFEGDRITGTEQWNFTYDHYVSPYQININVWYKDTGGYTYTGWMVVNIINRYVESGMWPTWPDWGAGMWYPGWIETNVTMGSTINLLGSTASVVGSRILELDGHSTDCWELKYYDYTYWYDKKTGLLIGMEYPYYYGYNLTLVATNIPISKLPVASFTYTPKDPFVSETVTFDASASYDPDGAIASCIWEFGDGTTGSGMTATHAYTAEGTYTVNLTVIDNDELNTTVTMTVSVSRVALSVETTVGSIHFTGEMAEFYVSVSCLGKRANANINATLYYANGTLHSDLSASVEHVATGLYRIPYTLPLNATAGTYVLIVDASLLTLEGTSMENFLLSPTFDGWNPLLVNIDHTTATIRTDLGLIMVELDALNATLTRIDGTTATIKTDLGLIMVELDALNVTVTQIDGTTATIQTTLGVMNGTITDIENDIATIQTPVGQIQADISNLKGIQETQEIPVQYVIMALALIAAAGSMFSIILIRRRKST